MRLNTVIIADDSAECDIRDLCIMLKDNTIQLLQQYQTAQAVDVNNAVLSLL